MMGGGMMGGMMGGWMILWWVLAVAVLALAVVGIAVLLRSTDRRPAATTWQRETAVDILRRRFAAGEIDEDEFQRRSAALS